MIRFLLKGIFCDRSRSVFPFLTVAAGVFLTVALHCYIRGVEFQMIELSGNYQTGHLKVMTRAYALEADQIPNDLALTDLANLLTDLESSFPELFWTPRIRFGGLLDIPDENGETRAQGPTAGLAADLFSPDTREWGTLDLKKALVRGRLPQKPREILLSEIFARKLGVNPGETATLISSTMHGSMSMANFKLAGTIRFGVSAMDRSVMIADIRDIQIALDMEDAAGEVVGFFGDKIYRPEKASSVAAAFNALREGQKGEFLPTMVPLHEQSAMKDIFPVFSSATALLSGIFVFAMSLVLWNAGLMGSLRRYGEIGVRLAIGESKGHVYRSLMAESLMIGSLGTVAGAALGLAVSYYLQVQGINIASLVKNVTIMMPTVLHSKITPFSFIIGFIPGLLATIIGTSISGIGIYRRQTSQLFKELET